MYRNLERPIHTLKSCTKTDPEDDDGLSKPFAVGENRIQRRRGNPSGMHDAGAPYCSSTVASLRRHGKLSACWARFEGVLDSGVLKAGGDYLCGEL